MLGTRYILQAAVLLNALIKLKTTIQRQFVRQLHLLNWREQLKRHVSPPTIRLICGWLVL